MKPTELTNWLHFDLTHVIEDDFKYEFGKANQALRFALMSKLPPIFYPHVHGDEPGECLKCNSVPHERRWY